MEKTVFLNSCDMIETIHFPRWEELPEFDLYMDQVIALVEKYLGSLSPDKKELITPSMINNYVKSGVLPPPKNKKYNRLHLALLMIICSAKSVLEISVISDIVMESGDIESLLDSYAKIYENSISEAVKKAREIVTKTESSKVLGAIALENALNAGASRTVAMYAYNAMNSGEKRELYKEEKKSKKSKKDSDESES
jgi:hypothetical protein